MAKPLRIAFMDRFQKFVEKTKSCWIWTGGINSTGRGIFWLNGKSHKAHRIAWEIANGPIPTGLIVCHKCDNGKCVNPEHLFLGTLKDNTQDCLKKRRFVGNIKVSKDRADTIRDEYRTGNYTQKSLASKYRLHVSTIQKIVTNTRKYAD